MSQSNIKLTSSEIASLWTSYLNNCMSKQVLTHMKQHVKDREIVDAIRFAYRFAQKQEKRFAKIFLEDKFAIPNGFTEDDVNKKAPALFTDAFCLAYINQMAKAGLVAYGGFLSMCTRKDIIRFFQEGLLDTSKLYQLSTSILDKKGLLVRAPFTSVPKEVDYIENRKYLSGFSLFHKKRPLNAVEVSHLFMNTQTNNMGLKITLAFAQTTTNKEVQAYMLRGKDISQKHLKIFTDTLLKEGIQSPNTSDIGITDSTVRTFSDKLMMFHISLLSASGIGNYALAGGASQRSDLLLNYDRLSIEIGQYAKDGADLMIDYNWVEQPPSIIKIKNDVTGK
ncbi:hypothetical protein CHH55_14035 [Niallia circulans]|uniref:DUF3231 family protein n=1 Tax=Niallia circulans TaxID=1397 RepID=UPI000BA4FDCA|nr:DUF3231 family protein [Niallia circulans]PAD26395.1 hypothetical protein CHH62_06720 [Niallia circulans]PAD87304.1 hypothetical protein CHH55_14035 [Niallia circulans]